MRKVKGEFIAVSFVLVIQAAAIFAPMIVTLGWKKGVKCGWPLYSTSAVAAILTATLALYFNGSIQFC